MEQVLQLQQHKENICRQAINVNYFEEEEEKGCKQSMKNHNKQFTNLHDLYDYQNKDHLIKIGSESSSTSNCSSNSQKQTQIAKNLSKLSCCGNTQVSKLRELVQNKECFEENTTYNNTSQSSLNTSSISCSSTQNIFEGFYFTRLPAPSSNSSTHMNKVKSNIKPRILYEEQDEDIDEVQAPSELEDNYDDEVDDDDEQQEENTQYEQKDNNHKEQLENHSDENSTFLETLSYQIEQYSHESKLIAQGSSCSIYSLPLNIPNVNGSHLPSIKNVVLKTSFHNPPNSDDCNTECQKLGKEFFVLQKFNQHPYIIQAYLLENDLYLPLYNAKKSRQYFSMDSPNNCCLVMEQATCDLITYFSKNVYEKTPHHHYNYLLNKHQSSLYSTNNQLNSNYYNASQSYFKNSFYNCFPGIFYDILSGLEEVHISHQLAHNDIKPENMLFFANTQSAKLCDFEHCSQRFDLKRTDFTYQSPEIVEIYKEYRDFKKLNDKLFELDLFKNDVFSFGVTLFSTMFGFYPFCDEFEKNNNDDLYSLLISANCDQFWQEKGISSICQRIEENTNSTYLYNFKKFIEETLDDNPSNRIDTSSLMNHDFFEQERHYRFEKEWYQTYLKQQQQQEQLGQPNSNTKYAVSTLNNVHNNSHANKSQISQTKISEQDEFDPENYNQNYPFFLSPQQKATSITCRTRQVSLESHFCLRRTHSFELKFDPIQTKQSFIFPPSSNAFIELNPDTPDIIVSTYPSQKNQSSSQNIIVQSPNQEKFEEREEQDEQLTKSSDSNCQSCSKIIDENLENKRTTKDNFFFDDDVEELDEEDADDKEKIKIIDE